MVRFLLSAQPENWSMRHGSPLDLVLSYGGLLDSWTGSLTSAAPRSPTRPRISSPRRRPPWPWTSCSRTCPSCSTPSAAAPPERGPAAAWPSCRPRSSTGAGAAIRSRRDPLSTRLPATGGPTGRGVLLVGHPTWRRPRSDEPRRSSCWRTGHRRSGGWCGPGPPSRRSRDRGRSAPFLDRFGAPSQGIDRLSSPAPCTTHTGSRSVRAPGCRATSSVRRRIGRLAHSAEFARVGRAPARAPSPVASRGAPESTDDEPGACWRKCAGPSTQPGPPFERPRMCCHTRRRGAAAVAVKTSSARVEQERSDDDADGGLSSIPPSEIRIRHRGGHAATAIPDEPLLASLDLRCSLPTAGGSLDARTGARRLRSREMCADPGGRMRGSTSSGRCPPDRPAPQHPSGRHPEPREFP